MIVGLIRTREGPYVPTVEIRLLEGFFETKYEGYSRVVIPFDTNNWEVNSRKEIVNKNVIEFPENTADCYDSLITGYAVVIGENSGIGSLNHTLTLGPVGIALTFNSGCLVMPLSLDIPTSEQIHAQDAVVEANRELLLQRSIVGLKKYGVPLAGASLSRRQLLQHALEEALDLANYLQAEIMRSDAE